MLLMLLFFDNIKKMDLPLTLQETYKHRLIDIISIYGHFKCFKVKIAIISSRSHNNPKQIKIKPHIR